MPDSKSVLPFQSSPFSGYFMMFTYMESSRQGSCWMSRVICPPLTWGWGREAGEARKGMTIGRCKTPEPVTSHCQHLANQHTYCLTTKDVLVVNTLKIFQITSVSVVQFLNPKLTINQSSQFSALIELKQQGFCISVNFVKAFLPKYQRKTVAFLLRWVTTETLPPSATTVQWPRGREPESKHGHLLSPGPADTFLPNYTQWREEKEEDTHTTLGVWKRHESVKYFLFSCKSECKLWVVGPQHVWGPQGLPGCSGAEVPGPGGLTWVSAQEHSRL